MRKPHIENIKFHIKCLLKKNVSMNYVVTVRTTNIGSGQISFAVVVNIRIKNEIRALSLYNMSQLEILADTIVCSSRQKE